jgi:hypothetical protein
VRVNPIPEYEQNTAGNLFADGDYNFSVVDAVEKTASTGNALIEMQQDVFNDDFTEKVRVVDRLVFTPNSYPRIDNFRKATGEKIIAGGKVNFEAEDCIGRKGRCHLKTTTYNGKSRNEIEYYLEPEPGNGQAAGAPVPAPVSKDPF